MHHPLFIRFATIGLLLLCGWLAGCDGTSRSGPVATGSHRELAPGTRFHDTLQEGRQGPEMVVIPAGRFMMGEAPKHYARRDSLPVHEVTIDEPFALSTHEITNAQYVRFLNAKGHRGPGLQSPENYEWVTDQMWGLHNKLIEKEVQGFWGLTHHYKYEVAEGPVNEQRPVVEVSWHGAQAYADWLSEQTGHNYRLPTEAEWEYATKAGTSTWYWWGNEVGQGRAACTDCGSQWDDRPRDERDTAPVGSFEPNPFGLYDVHGNAWEWVQDCWHPNYKDAPVDGSAWLKADGGECDLRVLRGGGITVGAAAMESIGRKFQKHPGSTVGGIRLARDL